MSVTSDNQSSQVRIGTHLASARPYIEEVATGIEAYGWQGRQ